MKATRFSAVFGCVTLACIIGLSALKAQEYERTTSFVALQKKRKKARGRLPNYYRAAGVTKAQTEKIYEIQATYRPKIEALEKQLEDLKSKQDAEVEAVLTPEQKKKVEELREAARKKRESRKKKGGKKKSTTKKES